MRKHNTIEIEDTPFSNDISIHLVLALINKMPSQDYGGEIAIEIGRLESIGKTLIEHLFLLNAITDPVNMNFTLNDVENRRI